MNRFMLKNTKYSKNSKCLRMGHLLLKLSKHSTNDRQCYIFNGSDNKHDNLIGFYALF